MSLIVKPEEVAASRTGRGGSSSVVEIIASATAKVVATASAVSGHAGSGGPASAAATTTAAVNKNKAGKAAKMKLITNAIHYTWYVTAGVVGLCFIVYAFSVLRARYIRRKVAAARRTGVVPSSPARGTPSPMSRLPSVVSAAYANFAYVRVFPLWIYSISTAAEIWWHVAYIGIVLGVGFWGCIHEGKLDYANPMGFVAFGQIPLIVGLASRNNILSWLTGISYEKLNYLHRASGRICVLTTWLHTLGWFHKGLGKHGPGSKIFLSGMLAAVALLIMWLSSFAIARRIFYELFLFLHITMGIIFIVGSYYHWPRLGEWCWVGLVIWAFDRIVSTLRMVIVNKAWLMPFSSRRAEHSGCTVELVDPDVVRLTLNRPNLRYSPGQHAFISMPGVALTRYEQHPMTMANIQNSAGDVTFIIRAQSGFTRRLVNRLQSTKASDINCYIDGPYGISHDLNHYDSVILVAGGTGVTYALAHFLSIIKASRDQTTAVSHARLVWNVRHAEHVSWIAPMLNDAVAMGTGSTQFTVDVYVTRSSASAEPGDRIGTSDAIAIESPDYSPSGSSENVTASEKPSPGSSVEKLALRSGLTAAAAGMVNFHRGRSHVESILRTDVDKSSTDAAGVVMAVCGPTQLTIDARRAVCRVNSTTAILKGQNPITFHTETFGW